MDIVVSIGPETADDAMQVTITDDTPYPDFMDDACRRAVDAVLRLHHELHPATSDTT